MQTHKNFADIKTNWYFQRLAEVTFQCPCCFAIETLLFEDGRLVNTSRWHQSNVDIFHSNCNKPARPFAGAKVTILSDNTDYMLLRLAEKKRYNIGNMAQEIGVARMTLRRWLTGKAYPNNQSKRKLTSYSKKLAC